MEAMPTASDSRQSFRDAGGQGSIVFDPTLLRQATTALFDPASYGADAQSVHGQGGRGAAWFVHGEFGDGVLRHYRRGGWAARASEDAYLWQGEQRVRSVREFELLQTLRGFGLPVPMPVAAYYRKHDWRYQAAIIVLRLADVCSFVERANVDGLEAPWSAVGATIGRCHRHRAHHSDLNANNVLIDASDKVWLIDWDKGRIESSAGHWRQRVLERLQRSLRKECHDLSAEILASGMDLLRAAHDRELAA
jgi:3-deoxy-D-manno-octulosonic acid kinase